MESVAINTDKGTIFVSYRVIALIIKRIVLSVKGVYAMDDHFSRGFSSVISTEDAEGVHVSEDADGLVVDLYVIARHGMRVPAVVLSMQEKVKTELYRVLGVSVKAVNVNIQKIVFESEENVN